MTHTYCAFGKCSTCSMLHSLHKCEISSKFSNLLHFTNKITHLRIHRTENAMRNYYNYIFSHTTRVQVGSRASLVDSRSHSTGADVLLSLSSTPNTQGTRKGKEEGKGRNNERKGIRKITGPTLWNYDSTSLIIELKPLYCV